MSRAYFDHASTSPLRPVVRDAMIAFLSEREQGGDASRIHTEGLRTRGCIEEARDVVAGFLGARSREVVFSSSSTEAVVTAIWGVCEKARLEDRVARVLVSGVEHSCVRDAAQRWGAMEVIRVDGVGRIDLAHLSKLCERPADLVCVQSANHEVGTVQPVARVVDCAREGGALVLCDATQSFGHADLNFADLDVDFLATSFHKSGGPTGIGALLIRQGLRVPALLVGSSQERARRAGIEHTLGMVGVAALCVELSNSLHTEIVMQQAFRGQLAATALEQTGIVLFGDQTADGSLPHIVCCGIEDVEAEPVLLSLDQSGIAAHSGSSCSSEVLEPSPVLLAMNAVADRSLRLSVGWNTTLADVDKFADVFPKTLQNLRSLR